MGAYEPVKYLPDSQRQISSVFGQDGFDVRLSADRWRWARCDLGIISRSVRHERHRHVPLRVAVVEADLSSRPVQPTAGHTQPLDDIVVWAAMSCQSAGVFCRGATRAMT